MFFAKTFDAHSELLNEIGIAKDEIVQSVLFGLEFRPCGSLFLQQLLVGRLNRRGERLSAFHLLAEPYMSSGRIQVSFRGFTITQHSCHEVILLILGSLAVMMNC